MIRVSAVRVEPAQRRIELIAGQRLAEQPHPKLITLASTRPPAYAFPAEPM
jgi:hypothetical protein